MVLSKGYIQDKKCAFQIILPYSCKLNSFSLHIFNRLLQFMIFQLDIYFKVSFRKASIVLSTLYKKNTNHIIPDPAQKLSLVCTSVFIERTGRERGRERERERERERDQVSYLRITKSLKGMMLILCCTFFSGDIIDRVWNLIVSVPELCFFQF